MERDNYIDGIRSAWLGELFGEVFFQSLADRAENDSMRAKWLSLAKLEQVTGQRMAAVLEAHGEAAVTEENIEVSDEILGQYTAVPHLDSMSKMRGVVEKAIVRFDQLLAVAPEPDVPSVQFLVHHEQALLTFVDREIAGDQAHALADVEKLLEQASVSHSMDAR